MQIVSQNWLVIQPLISISIVVVLVQFSPLKLIELSYEDLLITHSKVVDVPSDDVVVLLITENTLAKLPYRSPVDRAYLATVLDMLRLAGAKSVGVDILFDQSTEHGKDATLRKAFDTMSDKLVIASASVDDGLSEEQVFFQRQYLEGLTQATVLLAKSGVDGVVRHAFSGNVLNGVTTHNLARTMTSDLGDITTGSLDRIFYQSDKNGAPYNFNVYPAESVTLLPDEWIKDKYVLIGMDVPGMDQFRTPYVTRLGEAEGTMPGVMIHANMVSQILSSVKITEISKLNHTILLVIAALLGSFILFLEKSIGTRLLLAALAAMVILAIPYWFFSYSQILISAIPIAASLIVSVLIGTLFRWHEDRQQRTFIKNAWSRYVSPGIVNELLAHPEKLEASGERRDITLVFTDIADFTRQVESMPIERLTPMLNRYLDRVSSEFLDAGATIDKIMGDGIMGFFGAPLDDPDHADKAVALALRLDQVCREIQQELLLEDIAIGRTRIGVHSGIAIVGNFGGSRFFDYTAHGNTVNTASRLESANKMLGSSICVSGETAKRAVQHSFRPIGQLLLAGKQTLIDAWEPLPDNRSKLVPLEEYESAYRQLEHESEDAWHVFNRLSAKYPNDHLVSFYLDRLNRKNHGIQLETSK